MAAAASRRAMSLARKAIRQILAAAVAMANPKLQEALVTASPIV
jgi:hypothetical protein